MTEAVPSDLALREPTPHEKARIAHIFRNVPLPPAAQILAAVRTRPIERFIAAAACWQEGGIVRFRLASQPGVPRPGVASLLINRVEESARKGGANALHYAEALSDDSEWCGILGQQGFECLHSERFFDVPVCNVWTRVTKMHQKHQAEIPAGWRTDPIRLHPPEVILDLIAPHRLLPPTEVRQAWQSNTIMGFDLELSCILFDQERAFGTLLLRRINDALCVDVQVVHEPNPRLRSLGDLCLLYHDALRIAPDGPVRRIQFRSGEAEHRQTANLARRMGGRELPPRHLFGKRLSSP